jgi:hypothetical protein
VEIVVMMMDHQVTVTVVLVMLITADLIEGASADIQYLHNS